MTYDDLVKDYGPRIDAAYKAAHGHGPATSDQFHNAWRLTREGWGIDAVLADIAGQPYTEGPGSHPDEMLSTGYPSRPEQGGLSVRGRDFLDDRGQPWVFAGYHAHLLLPRMAHGEDIRPRVQEARDLGANTIIVIGCHLSDWKNQNGYRYDPRDDAHPARLAQLFDIAADESMRVLYKVLADCQYGVSDPQQHTLWQGAGNVARGRWNVLLSLGNEGGSNGWSPAGFSPLPDLQGVLQSKGDKNGNEPPYTPVWDFAEFESRRDLPKALTDASCTELYYGWSDGTPFPGITDRPIVNVEPVFFSDTDPDKWNDRRWTDPAMARTLGGYIGAGCAGGGFGASDGMEGLPLQPRAADCARQFYLGLRSAFRR